MSSPSRGTLPRRLPASLFALAFVVVGCSGGSDPQTDDGSVGVGDSVSNRPAADASEAEIRTNARTHAASVLNVNLAQAAQTDVTGDPTDAPLGDTGALDQNLEAFLDASLGLGAYPAEVTRDGDRLLIDPADAALCDQPMAIGLRDTDTIETCLESARQISVEIDAITDDTGTINYLFQGVPWLTIGYSPAYGSVEFNIEGFQRTLEYSANLQGETITVPETLTGAFQIQAALDATAAVPTAERISLHISQPLHIVDSANNTNVSIGVSELIAFRLNADNSVQINTSINAVNMLVDVASGEASNGDPSPIPVAEETTTYALVIQALTAQLDISPDGETRRISNAGVGTSPMQLMIDGETAVTLSLNDVALTVAADTVNIDRDLTLGVLMGNVLAAPILGQDPALGSASADLNLAVPAGTQFTELPNDVRRVDSGSGSISVTATGAGGTQSATLNATAGECITRSDDEADPLGLQVVACE